MEKKMSKAMVERLLIHSKLHRGGMRSRHMRMMIKFIKNGLSFTKAHNRAKKIESTTRVAKVVPNKSRY
tara:strand:+ start:158 stop:364 length:207 start_codon:yes stop_codon:yes gene_type:complete